MNRIASLGAALATTVLTAGALGAIAMDQGVLAGDDGGQVDSQTAELAQSPATGMDTIAALEMNSGPSSAPTAEVQAQQGAGGVPDTQPGSASDHVFDVMGAGTVTVRQTDGRLELVATSAAPGWTARIDDGDADEVEVVFFSQETALEFEAELEDGRIKHEIEHDDDRNDDRDDDRPGDDHDRDDDRDGGDDADDWDDDGREDDDD